TSASDGAPAATAASFGVAAEACLVPVGAGNDSPSCGSATSRALAAPRDGAPEPSTAIAGPRVLVGAAVVDVGAAACVVVPVDRAAAARAAPGLVSPHDASATAAETQADPASNFCNTRTTARLASVSGC